MSCSHLESTSTDTEQRLKQRLRSLIPELTAVELPAMITELRNTLLVDGRRKVLLVIDQFEQWLQRPSCRVA